MMIYSYKYCSAPESCKMSLSGLFVEIMTCSLSHEVRYSKCVTFLKDGKIVESLNLGKLKYKWSVLNLWPFQNKSLIIILD